MPEEKIAKSCSNCATEIDIKAKICPKCGVEQPIIPEKISNWWYALAVFLGIVGGVIAWAVNKDRNPKKAIRFLVAGLVLPVIYILISIVLFSLGGQEGRERARDASIIANISQIRMLAEIAYSNEGDYGIVSCAHPEIAFVCQDIKNQSGEEPIIHSTQENYCGYIRLFSKDYYCINDGGASRKTSVYPGGTGYCNSKTFACPY